MAPRISILVSDLSRNCLVRTYPLAKVLQSHFEVEVIGPMMGGVIFPPYRDELPYRGVPAARASFPPFLITLQQLVRQIKGRILYAFKPRLASFGVGLVKKFSAGRPLILDIEDWDAAPFAHQPRPARIWGALRNFHLTLHESYDGLFEKLVPLADERTVGSNFLRQRYGGIHLYHGVDCAFFDPALYGSTALKEKWGLGGKTVILFAGQVQTHKGLEDLLAALRMLGDPRLRLLLVGAAGHSLNGLRALAGGCLVVLEAQPHSRMPEFLALADLVVLPQRDTPYGQAQVPGKLFEAMAMAKPIVATAVSDLPEILSGCGWIVAAGRPEMLAQAIQGVIDNRAEAGERGWQAREKCVAQYSFQAMERILVPLFQRYGA